MHHQSNQSSPLYDDILSPIEDYTSQNLNALSPNQNNINYAKCNGHHVKDLYF